ncbi:MAG: hypothetical protein M0Z66_10955 [Thermaerobacter sp.]|nr:hypothetical protein [Thermaerobacter sp.]
MKRLLWIALISLALGGCAPSVVARLGQAAHMTLYLPTNLPQGLRFADGRRIGKRMIYLHYTAARRALVLFESPDPIAPPPGAKLGKSGIWEAVSVVRGQTVRSLLLHRKQTYVEAVATGLTQVDLNAVQNSLQAHHP